MNADPLMAQSPINWINEFLHCRGLNGPDGRALYAYRCTADEFDSLAEVLSHSTPTTNEATRAFVFYAAEWWQRRYDGHHWTWEPLLASIRWHIHYPDLYEPVRVALRWWQADLVRLPTSIRYLGTFACQGGLPLGLVGDADSRVVQYLRAVLNHTAEYRKFVDDAIDLARDQQHLLRPPTLRRDYVFRLAADLIKAVRDLQNDAQGEDPISTLDWERPGWRNTMPLDLENELARDLLTSLLREAVQVRPPTDDFRVERFLRRTSVGWRLGARVRLPASISAEYLAHHLNVSEGALPPRLQVRVMVIAYAMSDCTLPSQTISSWCHETHNPKLNSGMPKPPPRFVFSSSPGMWLAKAWFPTEAPPWESCHGRSGVVQHHAARSRE